MMDKSKAVEFKNWIQDIDSAIEFLQAAQKIGWNIYYVFQGHKLYSADITVDGAYKICFGVTKDEFEARLLEEEIEIYQNRGRRYLIDDALAEEWNQYVEKSFKGLYQGLPIKAFMKFESKVAYGQIQTPEDVMGFFEEDDNNHYGILEGLLKKFSKSYNKIMNDIENS